MQLINSAGIKEPDSTHPNIIKIWLYELPNN